MSNALKIVPPCQADAAAGFHVWNTATLTKMQVVNRTVRWLRENGYTALSIELFGGVWPAIHVAATAAAFLTKAGRGVSTRNLGDQRVSLVLIDGCEIRWQRAQPA